MCKLVAVEVEGMINEIEAYNIAKTFKVPHRASNQGYRARHKTPLRLTNPLE